MHKENSERIADCVKAFADSVAEYSELIFTDPKAANRQYNKFMKALKDLSKMGDDGLEGLADLLEDHRLEVRVTAACYVIHYCTERCLRVLKEAARSKGRAISMLAIVTLRRWEKGLRLDPATGKEINCTPG